MALDGVSCIIPLPSTCNRKAEIPFIVPPRFTTQNQCEQKEAEGMKMEVRRDILAHRGSLSVSSRTRPTASITHTHSQDLVQKRLSLLPQQDGSRWGRSGPASTRTRPWAKWWPLHQAWPRASASLWSIGPVASSSQSLCSALPTCLRVSMATSHWWRSGSSPATDDHGGPRPGEQGPTRSSATASSSR